MEVETSNLEKLLNRFNSSIDDLSRGCGSQASTGMTALSETLVKMVNVYKAIASRDEEETAEGMRIIAATINGAATEEHLSDTDTLILQFAEIFHHMHSAEVVPFEATSMRSSAASSQQSAATDAASAASSQEATAAAANAAAASHPLDVLQSPLQQLQYVEEPNSDPIVISEEKEEERENEKKKEKKKKKKRKSSSIKHFFTAVKKESSVEVKSEDSFLDCTQQSFASPLSQSRRQSARVTSSASSHPSTPKSGVKKRAAATVLPSQGTPKRRASVAAAAAAAAAAETTPRSAAARAARTSTAAGMTPSRFQHDPSHAGRGGANRWTCGGKECRRAFETKEEVYIHMHREHLLEGEVWGKCLDCGLEKAFVDLVLHRKHQPECATSNSYLSYWTRARSAEENDDEKTTKEKAEILEKLSESLRQCHHVECAHFARSFPTFEEIENHNRSEHACTLQYACDNAKCARVLHSPHAFLAHVAPFCHGSVPRITKKAVKKRWWNEEAKKEEEEKEDEKGEGSETPSLDSKGGPRERAMDA